MSPLLLFSSLSSCSKLVWGGSIGVGLGIIIGCLYRTGRGFQGKKSGLEVIVSKGVENGSWGTLCLFGIGLKCCERFQRVCMAWKKVEDTHGTSGFNTLFIQSDGIDCNGSVLGDAQSAISWPSSVIRGSQNFFEALFLGRFINMIRNFRR
ncbi:hypothetical protein HAX54_024960 [Datura stramonium]|uniref:Uncharacterized protein n=1 Tax=Datura stramonium TaxID=4076 RepID=A0ABS8UYX4_DATST|nr:hypothetical protein [Datura stramonium]